MTDTNEFVFDLEKIEKEAKEFSDRVYGDYIAFYTALASDLNEAFAIREQNDTQFIRRTLLRSLFSFIEGELFAKRQIILENINSGSVEAPMIARRNLTDAEYFLLQEIEYELDDNGTIKNRGQKYQPFLKYIRFIFAISIKFHGKSKIIDYGGIGWESFRKAYDVRNRITHPKTVADLNISDEEMNTLNKAYKWYLDSHN